jgi:hypothetical protein
LTAVGAFLWAVVPVFAGAWFHSEVEWVLARLADLGAGAMVLVAVLAALYVAIRLVERYLLIRFLRSVRISVAELRDLFARDVPPVILGARTDVARRLDGRRIPGAVAVDILAPEAGLAAVAYDRDVGVYCS